MEGSKTSITNLKVSWVLVLVRSGASQNQSVCVSPSGPGGRGRRLDEGTDQNIHLRLLLRLDGWTEPRLRLPGNGEAGGGGAAAGPL